MAQAKYNQIFQTLRGRIESGAYGFLEMLPSENTLAEEFACTRNTVRKALALLVAQAVALSEGHDTPLTTSGVLVVGSVVLAAEARALFGRP